jgi:outer membrane protein assembly factor BamB
VGDTAYFGVTDGHLYAVDVETGHVRWAYQTGGRINASPSITGTKVCVSTYAGSILCLDRHTGRRLWITYVSRNAFQRESFYASATTDGKRVYSIARSGKVVALSVASGRLLWSHDLAGYGYSTPAVAYGKVFVGGFDGALHCFAAASGRELWRARVGGRILGAPVVIGKLVFFANLETNAYAATVKTGRVVWRIGMGKYSPVIATRRHYFMALNGMLVAFQAQGTSAGTRALARALRHRQAVAKAAKVKAKVKAKASHKARMPAAPKR